MSRPRIEVHLTELDEIIDRSQREPWHAPEAPKLPTALHAMAERLLGSRTTEKSHQVLPRDSSAAAEMDAEGSRKAGPGRHPASAFSGAQRVPRAHPTLPSGDRCPECGKGKVYRQEPVGLVRFVGRPPREATLFEKERLRCNACPQIFIAGEPVAAGETRYAVTAVAMIALLKYGTGVPCKRLERLQGQRGMPWAAPTQGELGAAAQRLRAVGEELIRQAAQGGVMHNHDTGRRILRLVREPGDQRTGTFTSGIVSMGGTGRIARYFRGPQHAGENIAGVLKQRARELPAPLQRSDALSRNRPKREGVEPLQANCRAHGRRQFVEVVENFPEECRFVLETLRGV